MLGLCAVCWCVSQELVTSDVPSMSDSTSQNTPCLLQELRFKLSSQVSLSESLCGVVVPCVDSKLSPLSFCTLRQNEVDKQDPHFVFWVLYG